MIAGGVASDRDPASARREGDGREHRGGGCAGRGNIYIYIYIYIMYIICVYIYIYIYIYI